MSSLVLGNQQKANVSVKPRYKPVDNKQRWLALAPFIKERYKTDMTVKEIAAELAYQEYLMERKKDEMWKRFSGEIG